MDTSKNAVIVERQAGVGIVRLNQPQTMNALSPDIKAGLETHIPALITDPAIRCLLLTGTGKAFCAGGDIRSMKGDRSAPVVRRRMHSVHDWAGGLLDCEKPLICAVNGAAVGGGLGLALLGDIIFASSDAYFMSGFSKLGAVPDVGLVMTLTRAIGSLRANEMLLLNRKYMAEEAAQIGLANRCFSPETLMAEATAAARAIADGPTTSIGLTKMLARRAHQDSVEEFLEREAFAQSVAFGSPEFAEGVDAFLGKRAPKFPRG